MKVIELDEHDKRWKDFLDNNDHLIFHRPEWKDFTEDTFLIQMKYLGVEDDDKVQFIFPFGIINSSLFGNRLISVPYIEYGGFAGKKNYIQYVTNYIKDNYGDYDYLLVREGVPKQYMVDNGFQKVDEAKRFTLKLENPGKMWEKVHKMKRKAVRKAENMGVTVRNVGVSEVSRFYKLYKKHMKKYRSPAFPIKYFDNFWYHMVDKGLGKCLGAYLDGHLIAALLGFTYRDKVHITISVADDHYLEYRPNDLLHWEFINWASEEGYKLFDFGLAREDTGPFSFKEKWGGEIKDLNYYYLYLSKKKAVDFNPNNSGFKFLEWGWGLAPSFVTAKLEKKIRRELGI